MEPNTAHSSLASLRRGEDVTEVLNAMKKQKFGGAEEVEDEESEDEEVEAEEVEAEEVEDVSLYV